MIKALYFSIILLTIISCSTRSTKFYYYNGSINNGKYILASDLKYFFSDSPDIIKVSIKNIGLRNEVSKIKKEIIAKNQIIIPDDSYYVFAFTYKKDTLFADNRLEFWRYKDKGVLFKLNNTTKTEILKYYKFSINK